MPAFSENDIKQYKTAKTVGSVTSLGGAITATEVSDGFLHAMFDFVTEDEAREGKTEFRIVAFKNVNSTEDMLNPRALVINDSSSPNTTYAVGWMPSAVSTATQQLVSETDTPVGVVWCESARLQDAAIFGGNFPRGGGYGMLALRRTVKAGATAYKKDTARIVILCDNLDVGIPTPTGPPVPPIIDIGVVGEVDINDHWKKILENFKYRNMKALFTVGNNVGGSVKVPAITASNWLAMFGEVLRKVTWPCFGQRDRNPVVTNAIRDYFGLRRTYYTKQLWNAHITVIDTSDDSKVPYGENSDQFKILKKAMEDSRDNNQIDWRIVMVNRAAYGATTTPDEKKYLDETLQQVWAPVFEETKQQIVIQGTHANFQLCHVLRWDEGATDTPIIIPEYTAQAPNYEFTGAGFDHGVLYVTNGTGSADYDVIADTPSYVRYAQAVMYGGIRLRVDNSGQNKKLIGDFIDEDDKIDLDARFTITKK